MTVLQDLDSQHTQGGHVDELTLVNLIVHPLHSVWVALSTVECVAGHWLISGDETMLLVDTIKEGKVLIVSMWMVCL